MIRTRLQQWQRSLLFCLLLAGLLGLFAIFPSVASASPAWSQQFHDDFNRPNGAPGSNWTDSAGGIWSILSSRLVGTTSDGHGYTSEFLQRPASEAGLNQRVVATIPVNGMANQSVASVVLRLQSNGDYYQVNMAATSNVNGLYVFEVTNGSVTELSTDNQTDPYYGAINATHAYQLDFSAVGSSPTTLTLVLTDLTSSTTFAPIIYTDSTPSLQNATGVPGFVTWTTGGPTTVAYSSFTDYASPVVTLTAANLTSNVSKSGSVVVDVLSGASGNPDPNSVQIISGPAHGAAVDPPGTITYTPNLGYVGADSLVYQICSLDDASVCSQATLSFDVSAAGVTAPKTGLGAPRHENSGELGLAGLLGLLLLAASTVARLRRQDLSLSTRTR